MKAKKKRSDKGARVLLALLGVFLLLWNANTISLYLLGDVAPAYDIIVTRIGSRDEVSVGKEYRFNVSYTFQVDGVEYSGLDTGVRGPRLGPDYDTTVHYYPFAPRISSLFAEDAVTVGILLTSGFSLALVLLAVIPRKKKDKKSKGDQTIDCLFTPVYPAAGAAAFCQHCGSSVAGDAHFCEACGHALP